MKHVLISFLIAVLSGLGVGGGGLFVIYLSLFSATPQLAAQGLNLLFFIFSSSASVAVQINRRRICFSAVALMAVSGLIGAVLGAYLTKFLPEEWLRRAFGIMLVSGGIIALCFSPKEKGES